MGEVIAAHDACTSCAEVALANSLIFLFLRSPSGPAWRKLRLERRIEGQVGVRALLRCMLLASLRACAMAEAKSAAPRAASRTCTTRRRCIRPARLACRRLQQ